MEKRACHKCGIERGFVFDGFNKRGDKVMRDEKGTRWYNAVCGYCYYEKQRTCPHCGEHMTKKEKPRRLHAVAS